MLPQQLTLHWNSACRICAVGLNIYCASAPARRPSESHETRWWQQNTVITGCAVAIPVMAAGNTSKVLLSCLVNGNCLESTTSPNTSTSARRIFCCNLANWRVPYFCWRWQGSLSTTAAKLEQHIYLLYMFYKLMSWCAILDNN